MTEVWLATAALATGLAALLKVFWPVRSATSSEIVDGDVLSQFLELTQRLANVEAELVITQDKLNEALAELKELKKVETYLEGRLHEKDKELVELRAQRDVLVARVQHLEDICKRAGLNGEESKGLPGWT